LLVPVTIINLAHLWFGTLIVGLLWLRHIQSLAKVNMATK